MLTFGDINLGSGTYTLDSYTGNFWGGYLVNSRVDTNGIIRKVISGDRLASLNYGDTISSSSLFAAFPYAELGSTPGWTSGINTYIGLRIDAGGGNYNYGWANLTAFMNTSFTVTGFAFEDQVNTAILAGATGSAAVPEPGQVAASLLLLTGVAGYFAYRRRAGAATEPKALHVLALGARGITEFRENKAA